MTNGGLVKLKLVLDELDIPADAKSADLEMVQLGIYLAQVTGADLGYRFNWNSGHPFDSRLAADFSELSRLNGRIAEESTKRALIEGIRCRLEQARFHLLTVPSSLASELPRKSWMSLVANLHFHTERLGKTLEMSVAALEDQGLVGIEHWRLAHEALQRVRDQFATAEVTVAHT